MSTRWLQRKRGSKIIVNVNFSEQTEHKALLIQVLLIAMKVNRLLVAGVIVVFVTQLYFIDKITNGVRQLKGDPVIINGEDNYKNCGNAPAVHAPTSSVDGHISATPRALNDMVKYYAKNYTWTVVIGIPTTADKREARMRIRSTYLTHYPQTYCPHCEHPHPAPEVSLMCSWSAVHVD